VNSLFTDWNRSRRSIGGRRVPGVESSFEGRMKGVIIMEYDHLIIPGMNYRRTKEDIMKDVRHDASEWYDKELDGRLAKGGDRKVVVEKLDEDTKNWIDLEFQRRMNWNYQEEGTDPL
jgi:hypothetical protein